VSRPESVSLVAQGLTKRIGDRFLFRGLSLSIAEGQRVGLVAQNGTGKTSLLNILAGVDAPDEGEVILRSGLRIGYLPQSIATDEGDTRSGGQVKRAAIEALFKTEPDILILDEPTNHLDLGMVEWLESYLRRGGITLLMVTHDRYFLDRVCNVILEMDDERLYTYRGNYAYYLEKRQERIDNRRAEIARANNLYRTELEWMRSTPQARSHKARYREEAFYDIEKKARERIADDKMRLEMKSTYIGSKIFEAEYVSKAFPDGPVILKDFYYNFSRYEKMGIIGNNGTGKSTFVKLLLGIEAPDSGRFNVGDTVTFGYFSQEGMHFDEGMKVIDAVTAIAEYVDLGGGRKLSAMQFLQHFMFTPLQQQNYISKLSGGEKRRLHLCTVLMRQPNFLVLDEPTNDLDIMTLQVLEQYLQDFQGCVIVVSHDRYFMDRVVDHLLVFKGDGVIDDFPGNYTQYRAFTAEASQRAAAATAAPAQKPRLTEPKKRLSFRETKELETLEKEIAALESEKAQIEQTLSGASVAVDDIVRLSKRLPQLEAEMEEKTLRWMELEEKKDNL
jgi:ATP-binding cassette subfamily F protein uup